MMQLGTACKACLAAMQPTRLCGCTVQTAHSACLDHKPMQAVMDAPEARTLMKMKQITKNTSRQELGLMSPGQGHTVRGQHS